MAGRGRGKKLTDEQVSEICRLYESGNAPITISKMVNISSNCVRRYLKKHGIDTSYQLIKINPGDKFGRWTVLYEVKGRKERRYFLCECSCPDKTRREVSLGGLRSGRSKSCGCHKKESQSDRRLNSGKDYTGQIFGRLTVLYEVERDKTGQRQVMAQCSCPDKTIKKYQIGNLRSGTTSSCGCFLSENAKERNTFQAKDYQVKHPLFCKIEEIRDFEGGLGIEVRCKNSNCRKWYSPTSYQIQKRIVAIEKPEEHLLGTENHLYCSDGCKHSCPVFRSRTDPFANKEVPWTPYELQIFSDEVKLRQFEEYGHNFCEYKDCDNPGPYHAHHERPKSVDWIFALDPDNGIVFCSEHHYEIGHSGECSTGVLRKLKCNKE